MKKTVQYGLILLIGTIVTIAGLVVIIITRGSMLSIIVSWVGIAIGIIGLILSTNEYFKCRSDEDELVRRW